ncbi:MAG TPA: response regulator, partial [Candidatus Nitrosocosmicus sp.]|nr:response regulator [Candidatus Nitrosocosmicus sp.]
MKSRILLVDDEPAIAEWLRMVLEAEGYDVGVAGDSVSAMGQMTEREFALALVDLVLPDGDGLQLLQ